jgi:hypothetical protein
MNNILLSEHQQHCRAAHQQVLLLRDLYEDLLLDDDCGLEISKLGGGKRAHELGIDSEILDAKLAELELLPAPPDPEREGVLEALARLKSALGSAEDTPFIDRLVAEEKVLLELCEALAVHDPDPAIADVIARTRSAVERLRGAAA